MRHYELMIILDPNLEERTVQPSLDQFLKVVTGGGGKVEKVDIWGKRRLAYQIQKKSEGFYAVVDLTADPNVVLELDRQLNLNETICTYKPTRHATSPVAVATMITAEPACVFLTMRPRTKEMRPTTSVKMASTFSTGCARPSEFRMLWRWPESTVPATVTTSWLFHRKSSPAPEPGIHRFPGASARRLPRASDVWVHWPGCGQPGCLPAPARYRDTSCHGRTVAAPVQRRTQDAHAPLRTNDHPRP